MATARRFSYSLLISTLAFAVFAVFAFSGLFPWIEAQFYSPKVVADLQSKLEQASVRVDSWEKRSLDRLESLLADPSFEGLFSPTASQDALQKRFQSTKLFLLGLRGGGTLRVLDADRTQVHFSSEESDVKVKSDFRLTYRPVAEILGLPDLKTPGDADGKVDLLTDSQGLSVYFLRPWKDKQGLTAGYALLEVSLEDLRLYLLEEGVPWAQQPLVALGANNFLMSLLGHKLDSALVVRIRELQTQGILPPVQRLGSLNGQFSVSLIHKGNLNLVLPSSALELNDVLKYLLLASFYTVIFLVTFLLANLRGEPLSIVTRKVKRFQLQVVRQYLDLKEQDKIQSLRDELAQHSDEIRSDVRRSLGRVRKRDQEWVDRYIDTSWQEVMDLLRGPSPPVESTSNADWKRLETLLQQALTQGRFVISHPVAAPVQKKPAAQPGPVAEAVEDLEEVEEAEAVEDLEEVEDAEAVEDLEEVEDAEAVEDLEEVEDAEAVEDLEEIRDTEVVEDLEELDDAEVMDNADAEEGALEELSSPPPALDFSQLRRSPAGDGGAVSLLIPSSDEESLEELDELEEVLEDPGTEPEGEDSSYPLERLDAAWGAVGSGYFDESEDVVTLRDDLFAEASVGNDAFGQLVDEVLAGPDFDAFEPLEEDLVPRQVSREWRWTGGGFDWDRFALGSDEVDLFRALSDIVARFDGFTAAILTETEGVWRAQSSVGFSDSGKELLSYPAETPLAKSFLSIRALHVLKGGASHPILRASFHAKDLKFLKSVLCVPLLFRHQPAWLLLGLRHEPQELLDLLAPRRFD